MIGDWIRQTTSSTGTGNLTLAAVTDYPTFNNIFGLLKYFRYTILRATDGKPLERGIGHMSSSTVLVRDKIIAANKKKVLKCVSEGLKNIEINMKMPFIKEIESNNAI